MKNWYWATLLFAVGYSGGTIMGFATYYVGVTVMWVSLILVMPPLFAYLCGVYLTKARCTTQNSKTQMLRLVFYWILLALGLDALTYILVIPALFHANPNWNFFVDQSPWIWISYATLLVSGFAGRHFHDRHLARLPKSGLGVA